MDAAKLGAGARLDEGTESFRLQLDGALDGAYRRAAVLLGSRMEAEDAVHDAAERAWRARRSLRAGGQFEAWFATILVNVCRDRLRKRRRVAMVEVRGALAEAEDTASTTSLRQVDDRSRLIDALATLSPDERIAVVLRFESDLTVPQIAHATGHREGTIKARLHHALRKLRVHLGEEGSDD